MYWRIKSHVLRGSEFGHINRRQIEFDLGTVDDRREREIRSKVLFRPSGDDHLDRFLGIVQTNAGSGRCVNHPIPFVDGLQSRIETTIATTDRIPLVAVAKVEVLSGAGGVGSEGATQEAVDAPERHTAVDAASGRAVAKVGSDLPVCGQRRAYDVGKIEESFGMSVGSGHDGNAESRYRYRTKGRFQMRESLAEWIVSNTPKDEMIYKNAAQDQCEFIANTIRPLIFLNIDPKECKAHVIGTHKIKSIRLPVVEFWIPGLRFVMRDNFYNWKVSVQCDKPIDIDPDKLFDPNDERSISDVYCEGFELWDVFGTYAANKQRFTVELYKNEDLIEFCTRVLRSFGINSRSEDLQAPNSLSE